MWKILPSTHFPLARLKKFLTNEVFGWGIFYKLCFWGDTFTAKIGFSRLFSTEQKDGIWNLREFCKIIYWTVWSNYKWGRKLDQSLFITIRLVSEQSWKDVCWQNKQLTFVSELRKMFDSEIQRDVQRPPGTIYRILKKTIILNLFVWNKYTTRIVLH